MASTPAPAPHAQRVARHYDVLDPYYRLLWGEHLHHGLWRRGDETVAEATEALLRHVADRAGLRPGASVLDLGSGYGATARFLAQSHAAGVTALTLSPVQHAHALAADPVSPAPDYRLGDFLDADLPSGAYDAVLAVESLSHRTDLDATLRKIHGVLRPGGRFVACVWLSGDRVGPLRRRFVADPIVEEGRLARLAPAGAYEAAVARAGLVVEGLEDLSHDVRRTWWICLRGVAARLARDPEARRAVARGGEGVFARTVPRLLLAYWTGTLRYGVFTAAKPSRSTDAGPHEPHAGRRHPSERP